jgi:hypothetical protein
MKEFKPGDVVIVIGKIWERGTVESIKDNIITVRWPKERLGYYRKEWNVIMRLHPWNGQ